MKLVTIVAISVDSQIAVVYHKDGSTTTIPQGDARLPAIVEIAKRDLPTKGEAEVDIAPVFARRTEFEDAEAGTKGLIKFFRVARNKLKEFFSAEEVTAVPLISPMTLGVTPEDMEEEEGESESMEEVTKPVELTNSEKLDAAQERLRILTQDAASTQDSSFHATLDEEKECIVAVNTETGNVIPDAQKLAPQLRAASKLQDYTGFTRFIQRLELIIKDRKHSVEDLMKFIEKGDLPIADDGCIVIYKRLNKHANGGFVDCHTGKVHQRVGSYVFMRPDLVDPNRRNDCSNGLHVATLNYISSFSGNVTIIGKVRPEDVFAVPEYSVTKMRVCGYHIIAELPDNLRQHVNSGGSISEIPEGKVVLNKVLSGDHIGVNQHVEIGGHRGTNVTITDVDEASAGFYTDQVKARAAMAETIDLTEGCEPIQPKAAPIDVAELAKQEKASTTKNKYQVKLEQVLEAIFQAEPKKAKKLAEELVAMKKAAKKGWGKLGITPDEVDTINQALLEVEDVAPAPVKPEVKMSNKDRATELYSYFQKAKASGVRADIIDAANELQFFLKSTKKGIKAYGLPDKAKEELKTWATSK